MQQETTSEPFSLRIKNRQWNIAKTAGFIAFISALAVFLPYQSWSGLKGNYALSFIALFLFLSSVVVAFIFRSRARKMDKLIWGEEIISSWTLDDDARRAFADHLFTSEKGKNNGLFIVITLIMVLFFGLFILFMEEGRWMMFLFFLVIMTLIALFAFGMPYYYRFRNNRGDGYVVIGRKYAYVNGFFHNWDFPLSGLKEVKVIQKPYYGILLRYYYYDRTLRNEEVLTIPAIRDIDLKQLIEIIKS